MSDTPFERTTVYLVIGLEPELDGVFQVTVAAVPVPVILTPSGLLGGESPFILTPLILNPFALNPLTS